VFLAQARTQDTKLVGKSEAEGNSSKGKSQIWGIKGKGRENLLGFLRTLSRKGENVAIGQRLVQTSRLLMVGLSMTTIGGHLRWLQSLLLVSLNLQAGESMRNDESLCNLEEIHSPRLQWILQSR